MNLRYLIQHLDSRIFIRLLIASVVIVSVIFYNVRYQLKIVKDNAKLFGFSRRPPSRTFSDGDILEYLLNSSSSNVSLYSVAENTISEASITWADFLTVKKQPPRAMRLKLNRDAALVQCSPEVVLNTTAQLPLKEKNWCTWALSESGGKVKLGESYGSLTPEQRTRFDYLHCDKTVGGHDYSCDDVRKILLRIASTYN